MVNKGKNTLRVVMILKFIASCVPTFLVCCIVVSTFVSLYQKEKISILIVVWILVVCSGVQFLIIEFLVKRILYMHNVILYEREKRSGSVSSVVEFRDPDLSSGVRRASIKRNA